MSLTAVEKYASTFVADKLVYNPDKWNLSSLMQQRKDVGNLPFIGPSIVGVARPFEQSVGIPGQMTWAMQWVDKIGCYTTGTVSVSGADVTGVSTAWKTAGVPIGAKIGFGSTDKDQITQWYGITDIATDTSIVLDKSAGTITAGTAFCIDMTMQKDWVFLADGASAAATRRLVMYEYNRVTSEFTWNGYVTLTFPTTTNHTIRGFRMTYDLYTAGTVAVSGATVTGTGTSWVTDRLTKAQSTMAGSRIGFGSKIPSQIKQWYHINAISADGTMTIAVNATGTLVAANITIPAGTDYVIEDLRAIVLTTNATTANGGLFLVKGLSKEKFVSSGSTILGTATTGVDANMCNVYWLADAATNTFIAGCGLAICPKTSWQSQVIYAITSTGGCAILKFNIRAALSITSGSAAPYKDITAYQLITGAATITGTLSATNNGRYANAGHGPLSGQDALYFVTTTRIYGVPLSAITAGATTFLNNIMLEIPPGGAVSYATIGGFGCIEYASNIDRFIVMNTTYKGYVTKFRTDSGPMDHYIFADDRQTDQASADTGMTPHPTPAGGLLYPWAEAGILYIARGSTSAQNNLHAVPIGADWNYTDITGERVISPKLLTPNCYKFHRFYFVRDKLIGNMNFGKSADPVKIFYRTTGIDDNTGAWTELPEPYDLTGVDGATSIQFAFTFKCISDFCVPTRLFLLGVIYEDLSTDSHFEPSVALSIAATKQFAWKFTNEFGATVPTLRIRLYNADTDGLLLDDNSANPAYGTWGKSTDGGVNWTAYNTNDRANGTTYIRYIPSSLGDNLTVRALLTQQ